jgi:hypothetical protein
MMKLEIQMLIIKFLELAVLAALCTEFITFFIAKLPAAYIRCSRGKLMKKIDVVACGRLFSIYRVFLILK